MNAARKLLAIAAMTIALLGVAPVAGAVAAEHTQPVDRTAVAIHSDNTDNGNGPNDYTKLSTAPTSSVTVSSTCNKDGGQCLPYNRWNGATMSLHGRFDGFGQVLGANYAQRSQIASLLMGFGNGVFQMGAGLVDFAQNLKVVDTFGRYADQVTAEIGQVMINSPIALGAVVVGVGLAIFGLRRGVPPWKRLTSTLMIYGTLAILIGGAMQTDRQDSGFGIGSPGWLANGTNQTVMKLLDGTADMITDSQAKTSAAVSYGDCAVYVQNLLAEANASPNPPSATEKTLNLAWEQTGLQAFKAAQYKTEPIKSPTKATDSAETFGDEVYCRQLDIASGITANEQMNLFFSWNIPGGSDSWKRDAVVWGNYSSNPDLDQALVGMAACMYDPANKSFTLRPGFTDEDNGKGAHDTDCDNLYKNTDDTPDVFNFDSNDSDVTGPYNRDHPANYNAQPGTAAMTFVSTLHGSNNLSDGTYVMSMWALSSLLYAVVLIIIAVVAIFAKFACVAMIFSVVFAAIGWMLRQDGADQMAKYGKMYIGFAVVAACSSLILAVVTMLSNILAQAGNGMFGAGSAFALLWAGLCPAIAAVILHFVFKKVLRMPSPMTPSGALGWAAAAGGGAIAGGALGGLVNRFQNRAGGALKSGGKAAAGGTTRAALRAATGGRFGHSTAAGGQGRLGKMAPKGAITAGAGGAAAAGAIGAGKVNGQLPAGAHDITTPQKKSWSEKLAGASNAAIKWSENTDGYRDQVKQRAIQSLRDQARGLSERVVTAKESITKSTQATTSVMKNPISTFKAAAITPEFWEKAANRGRTAAKVAGIGAIGAFTGGAGFAAVGMAGAGAHSAAKAGVEKKRQREEERAAFAGELAAVTAEKQKAVEAAERELEKARAEIGRAKDDQKKRPEAMNKYNEAMKLRDKANNNLDAAQAAADYFNANKRVPARPQGPARQ